MSRLRLHGLRELQESTPAVRADHEVSDETPAGPMGVSMHVSHVLLFLTKLLKKLRGKKNPAWGARCSLQASRACVVERGAEDRQQASVQPMLSNAATVATSPDDGGCGGTSANFEKFSIDGLKNG